MTYKLVLMYNGSQYFGYERQKDKRTVQGELENSLQMLYGEKIKSVASGRTDARVHALGQVVSFSTQKIYPENEICSALNSFLPSDIRVKSVQKAADEFCARRTAKKKTYCYDFYVADVDNPLLVDRALRLARMPDINLMKLAAGEFVGQKDFKNFYCKGSSAKTTVRHVYECTLIDGITSCGESIYRLQICANGFLYKMVRLIMGTLIRLGEGKISFCQLQSYIKVEQEYKSKLPAPPTGLCLMCVEY